MMNDQIVISLILPCYNVEDYIETCLNSIYNQNLSENEYEVICVNDCSTDNTVDIIKSYQKKHANLILVEHTENKKLGAARNSGFNICKGQYVWFIDTDDYITENCLLKIKEILTESDIEILQFNINITDENVYPEFLSFNFKSETSIMNGIEYLKLIMKLHWGCEVQVWRRIFKKDFLIKNKLYFSENTFGVEDVLFFYKSTVPCKRYKHITDYLYTYRIDNEQSITNSSQKWGLKLADKIISNVEVIHFFKNDSLIQDEAFIKKAINSYKWSLHIYIKKIYILDRSNLKDFTRKILIFKNEIKSELNWFEANLITNTLFVKVINTIFARMKSLKNKKKINK